MGVASKSAPRSPHLNLTWNGHFTRSNGLVFIKPLEMDSLISKNAYTSNKIRVISCQLTTWVHLSSWIFFIFGGQVLCRCFNYMKDEKSENLRLQLFLFCFVFFFWRAIWNLRKLPLKQVWGPSKWDKYNLDPTSGGPSSANKWNFWAYTSRICRQLQTLSPDITMNLIWLSSVL